MSYIDDGVKLFGLYKKWVNSRKVPEKTVATRFVALLESHGVHRNQIPGFIGHGLTVADVKNDEILLDKLNEEILDYLCKRFVVRREWLDGVDDQIYPCHDFYKNIDSFVLFIKQFKGQNIGGILIAPKNKITFKDSAFFILQEPIGNAGEKTIFRYYLCNNWCFSYWKSRVYLTACIASAWSHGVCIHGIFLSINKIQKMYDGESFIGKDIYQLGRRYWHPEDMALLPNKFLEGIDKEKNNFGAISALKFWLELENQGFMDTKIRNKKAIKKQFQDELLKQQAFNL